MISGKPFGEDFIAKNKGVYDSFSSLESNNSSNMFYLVAVLINN